MTNKLIPDLTRYTGDHADTRYAGVFLDLSAGSETIVQTLCEKGEGPTEAG